MNRIKLMVLREPRMLLGKLWGLNSNMCFYNLTAKRYFKKPFKTIIDVGANVGDFIQASNWVFPGAEFHCFEPLKSCYEKLKFNIFADTYNFGLSDKNVKRKLYENVKHPGSSSFLKPTSDEKIKERTCELKRFDSLNIKIRMPCFLKIDTEGHDYEVLKGFGDRLREVDVVQFEVLFKEFYEDQSKLHEIIKLLDEFGFKKFVQTEFHDKGGDLMFFRNIKDA